jgi:uroporphyrinogen-III decarboxylase
MNSKERCLAAIHGRPVDRVPVFPLLMFFAADRARISYRQFATNGAALADAQLNIRERFGIDAITACSDAFRVSAELYREFALPYEQRVCEAFHRAGGWVKLHVCGNTNALLPDMARCGADLFNVDHMVKLKRAVEVYGAAGKCIKGNLNPVTDEVFAAFCGAPHQTSRIFPTAGAPAKSNFSQ